MQAYKHFMQKSFVKKRQTLHWLGAEGMSREDRFTRLLQFFPVVGMDRAKRLPFPDLISHLAVDDKPNRVIDRVRLARPPGPNRSTIAAA